jgi:hypothetical protein
MLEFFKSEELGSCYIAIAGAEDWGDWQIKIAENYEDPLDYCRHALFIFEDLTYIIERAGFAVDIHTGLKKEMKAILEHVRVCLPVLYYSAARLVKSPFPISQVRTDTVSLPIDLLHESKLYRKRGSLQCQRTRFQSPGWPESSRYQAAAVFAVFDHMVMKVAKAYHARDPRHLRILCGVDTTVSIAEKAGMFGAIGRLEESSFGKLPRSAIEEMDSLTDTQLEQRYAEQIKPELENVVRGMSSEEVWSLIQVFLTPDDEEV